MEDISAGVWIDTDTNTVVTSPPQHGIQIAAPGCALTPDIERAVALAKAELGETKPRARTTKRS